VSGHSHDYLPEGQERSERATHLVIGLTAITMVIEIVAGSLFHSMALLADGWHMASHASALGITAFAYSHARRNRSDRRYTFGTWKVGVLGGYSSAVVLGVIAVLIGWESGQRLLQPVEIQFDQAIAVAALGLVVNLVSAFLLREGHSHGAASGSHHHHDHNLRGAFLHVAADALTSLFAIAALLAGKIFGWSWMDPIMGVIGALIIGRWSYGLLRDSSRVLLDRDVEGDDLEAVRLAVESDEARLVDLHIWRIGPGARAAILSVESQNPRAPEVYRERARAALDLTHVTVEVNSP
jgi:cation diffusion facilitator family transporter